MAFDFISSFVGLFLEDRFEEIKDYRLHASDIQSEQLFNLLREAEDTDLGKKYDFKTIFSYQDFRERLPIQKKGDFKPFVDRIVAGEANVVWPGLPKSILNSFSNEQVPISEQALEENFFQGINDGNAFYLHHHPKSKLYSGYSVSVGEGQKPFNMEELQTLLRDNESFISSLMNLPKRSVNERGNTTTDELLQQIKGEKVSSFKGSSDSLTLLLEKAGLNAEKSNLSELWPEAEVFFQRGAEITSELIKARESLPQELAYQATYCSPEGLFGIQDKPGDSAFLLMLDLSTFYEFIPSDEPEKPCIPLEDIDLNIDYQMVVTNCSGLWRYCSGGPKLHFISKNPYRFILH